MTTTHYVLIGLGAILIAGLLLYNFLQERRFRKQADRMFSHKRGDILLGDSEPHAGLEDGRIEPRIGLNGADEAHDEPDVGGAVVQSIESLPKSGTAFSADDSSIPEVDLPRAANPAPAAVDRMLAAYAERTPAAGSGEVQEQAPPPVAASPSLPPSPLDPEVEYVARLRFTQATRLSFARLLDGLRRLGKPIRAYGLRQDGGWEPVGPNPAVAYLAVEIGVQLADRTGPASDSLLDGFCRALYTFATEHGGAVSCPERKAALDRARDLDQFCMEVDVLIGLNIVAKDGATFSGDAIHTVAVQSGLALDQEGAYVLKEAGHTLFSLVNQEETPFGGGDLITHGITLLFDVPRIADGLKVFDRMTDLGFQLADDLNGRMVDDSGRGVTQETLMKDRQRLSAYYARMQERGVVPGSERALRLFR